MELAPRKQDLLGYFFSKRSCPIVLIRKVGINPLLECQLVPPLLKGGISSIKKVS